MDLYTGWVTHYTLEYAAKRLNTTAQNIRKEIESGTFAHPYGFDDDGNYTVWLSETKAEEFESEIRRNVLINERMRKALN